MNLSEHVEVLNMMLAVSTTVDDWNKWRRANPGVQPLLREADLRGKNLIGLDLSKADLRGACLSYANLTGADLTEADLSSAVLFGANLDGARLQGTRFSSRSMLNYVKPLLTDVQLTGAIFEDEEILRKEKTYLPQDAHADKVLFTFAGEAPFTPLELGFLLTGIQLSYNRFDYLLSTEDIDIKRINYTATTPCYVGVERDIQIRSITRGSWILELTRLIDLIPPELLDMGLVLSFGKFAQQITTAVRNVFEAAKLKAEAEKLKTEAERLKANSEPLDQENGPDNPSMPPAVCPDNAPIRPEEQTELFSAVQCDPAVRQAASEALSVNPLLAPYPDLLIESSHPLQLGIYNVIKNGERGVTVTIIPAGEK